MMSGYESWYTKQTGKPTRDKNGHYLEGYVQWLEQQISIFLRHQD
jgi:hypothetical protein